jgi:hypothetical protein
MITALPAIAEPVIRRERVVSVPITAPPAHFSVQGRTPGSVRSAMNVRRIQILTAGEPVPGTVAGGESSVASRRHA